MVVFQGTLMVNKNEKCMSQGCYSGKIGKFSTLADCYIFLKIKRFT